ncbi:DUF448 domain-containing protein [Pelotalea chapellei]|uniref:DUF448 domain-containing protein n=1 Tax=Pelotalea chapellei TaxID=44671 RepID=A0ABS5U5T9_9BACT|nr:DUF448 domain-containing protein [Pelotalea chapellei]MBT1071035.1 DUF448 domain-containing protein [Pelotalea chapellei]
MSRAQEKEKPQRSCLGCRTVHDKEQLIRFVLSPQGEVVPDIDGRLPGRGSYTCIKAECLATAAKLRTFNRSFKQEVNLLPPADMVALVGRLMRNRILGFLGLANRAGKVISGGSLVSDAIRGKIKPGIVLVASDVSENIGEKIVVLARVHGIPCECLLTKDEFGAILGKAPRSAIAVKPGGFVIQLANEIKRYRNFLGEV